MAPSAMDSGWFAPLPSARPLRADYVPSLTGDAVELFARIRRDPNDRAAVDALVAHYQAHDDMPSMANLMEGWAAHLATQGAERDAATACVRAAECALSGSADLDRAEQLLARALRHDPTHERGLRKFHSLLASRARHVEAKIWLERAADVLAGDAERASFRARVCYRLGRLLEVDLADADAALSRYAESLRNDSSYEPAREALRRLQDGTLAREVRSNAGDAGQASSRDERRPVRRSVSELRARLRGRASVSEPAVVQSDPGGDVVSTTPRAALVSREMLDAVECESIEVNLGATTESNFYVGFSNEPLRAGVFVATYRSVAAGSELRVTLTLPGGLTTDAIGRVRFIRDGLLDDDSPGLGIQFTKLTRESCELIERFMKKRAPLFFSA